MKPYNWHTNISRLKSGYRNEDLMVWMRTSAFPTFKKLYGRVLIEHNSKLSHKIPIVVNSRNHTGFETLLNLWKEIGKGNDTIDEDYVDATGSHVQHRTLYRLPKGQYFLDIEYRYPVRQMNGRKHVILANVAWLGGKCYFMAGAYVVVGIICLLASVFLFIVHVYHGNM